MLAVSTTTAIPEALLVNPNEPTPPAPPFEPIQAAPAEIPGSADRRHDRVPSAGRADGCLDGRPRTGRLRLDPRPGPVVGARSRGSRPDTACC